MKFSTVTLASAGGGLASAQLSNQPRSSGTAGLTRTTTGAQLPAQTSLSAYKRLVTAIPLPSELPLPDLPFTPSGYQSAAASFATNANATWATQTCTTKAGIPASLTVSCTKKYVPTTVAGVATQYPSPSCTWEVGGSNPNGMAGNSQPTQNAAARRGVPGMRLFRGARK